MGNLQAGKGKAPTFKDNSLQESQGALRKHQRVGGSLGRALLQPLTQEGRPEPAREHKKSCRLLDELCLQEKQQKAKQEKHGMQVVLRHFDPCRVFQHIQESWFEARHAGWGMNSQDRPWDTLAELLTAQAGSEEKERKKDQSLLHRKLKCMGMGWQWDPLIQRDSPGSEGSSKTAFREHQTHESTVSPQQL